MVVEEGLERGGDALGVERAGGNGERAVLGAESGGRPDADGGGPGAGRGVRTDLCEERAFGERLEVVWALEERRGREGHGGV